MESTSNIGSWNGHWTYIEFLSMLCLLKNNPQQHPKVGPYLLSHPRFGQWKGTFFFEVSPLYSDISSSHFIWHSDILYLEFYLTYNYINLSLPFYLHLSAIYSDILSGDLVVILSDIFLWQFALAFYLTHILTSDLTLHRAFLPAFDLASYLASILTSCLTFYLAFYLACLA